MVLDHGPTRVVRGSGLQRDVEGRGEARERPERLGEFEVVDARANLAKLVGPGISKELREAFATRIGGHVVVVKQAGQLPEHRLDERAVDVRRRRLVARRWSRNDVERLQTLYHLGERLVELGQKRFDSAG